MELEQLARPTLKKMVRLCLGAALVSCARRADGARPQVDGFYSSGAESQSTLQDNRAAFAKWRLVPRCMVDVSAVDMSCQLLGACRADAQLRACLCLWMAAHTRQQALWVTQLLPASGPVARSRAAAWPDAAI